MYIVHVVFQYLTLSYTKKCFIQILFSEFYAKRLVQLSQLDEKKFLQYSVAKDSKVNVHKFLFSNLKKMAI